MTIRKKSNEELKHQVEGFLDYEEKNGKITEEKKKEILEILKGEDLKTQKVDEIKNNLLSVLSPDEFDGLYGRYLEFPKKNRKELKEFILKLGILPKGYEFLVKDLLKPIGYYVTVEDLKKEGIQEMAEELKIKMKNYIEFFENDLGVPKDELSKNFEEFDIDFDIVKAKNNLKVLNLLGITDKEDVIQFVDVIVNRRTEKLKENIEAIKSTGITSKEDLVKLCKIISSVAETDEIKANIEALQSAGITSAEDIGELGDVIIGGRYTEKIKANIEILKSMGITSIKDIGKLNFIINFGDPEKIKANIEALQSVGITSIEDIGGLYGLVNYGDAEKIKANIEALQSMGITSVKEIGELHNIVSGWPTENIYTLNKVLGIESFKDFKKFLIFGTYFSESSYKRIDENIHVLIDNKIVSKQELIDNISELRWIVENGEKLNFKTLAGICTGNIENLKKLSPVIQNSHAASISAFVNDAGITNIDDLLRLEHENLFAGDPTIIRAFIKAGMKSVDDFIILKEKMSSLSLHEKKAAENIQAFYDAGIRKPEDFVFLSDLIRGYDTRTDLIKAFHKAGIDKAEDFFKLGSVIRNYKIEAGMIQIFSKAGMKSADDFYSLYMNDLLENAKTENVERLSEAGIKSVDEFLKLEKLCTSPDTPLIFDELNYAHISDENLIEILEIISNELNSEQFCLFTFLDKLKDKIPANIYDDLCGLKELYNELPDKCSYSYQLGLKILLFYHKGFSIEEIRESIEHDLFTAKYENLEIIFEKYPNIEIVKLKNLKKILTYAKYENLEIIFEKYPNIEIVKLKNLKEILTYAKPENLEMIFEKYPNIEIVKLKNLKEVLSRAKPENLEMIFAKYPDIEIVKLKNLKEILSRAKPENLEMIFEKYPDIEIVKLKNLKEILSRANPENLEMIFAKYPDINIVKLKKLEEFLSSAYPEIFEQIFLYFEPIELNEISNYKKLCCSGLALPEDTVFKEDNHKGYLKYIVEVIDLNIPNSDKQGLISHIVKLPFGDIDNYLGQVVKFLSRGFDIQRLEGTENLKILNDSINTLYPGLNVEFNEEEAEEILGFVDSIGGINKGYSILILTIEKLQRDGIKGLNLNRKLIEKIRDYKKVLDIYPEDKIPDGLKISVGLEIEMTNYFLTWYEQTTGKNYYEVVNNIVNNAKVGIEREGVYEFATKPSTNPMAALLEIHLLNELNLLDINDMQKLLEITDDEEEKEKKEKNLIIGKTDYNGRNGTGYHLNIGSDADIGVDENIQFIQNFCTILPRGGMNNGRNVKRINPHGNMKSKTSSFSVFPNSESKQYVELRTYSVDDVELFEKNVLFNTYAIMGSQAQKKVSKITPNIVMRLRDNEEINNQEDLQKILEHNHLIDNNQDIKSRKVAIEFIFMQISILRAISHYNKHFIDDELFGIGEISNNLNEPWKNYFMDLLCLDNEETIGYAENGHSSGFVRLNCKKLYSAFKEVSLKKYLEKTEPFSGAETKKILNKYGEVVDENKISLVTIRLNKKLLWEKLIIGCDDTQKLEGSISEKRRNMNRIKSSIKGMDKSLKVDKEYLEKYFKSNMSLIQYSPYHAIDTEFMNRIINLNNFFLKKDDTNANQVLQKTIFEGEEEPDVSKSSIFETGGYMRKGYNYYQGGTENMLLHSAQKIAINYMENVRKILNTDYENENSVLAKAA